MPTTNILMKIGHYSPTNIFIRNKYDAYCRISTHTYSPSLSFSGIFQTFKTGFRLRSRFNIEQIFSSPLPRAHQTAKIASLSYLPNQPPIYISSDLSEIPFNMASLLTKKEFQSSGSALVRQRFIDSFIADRLLLPRFAIQSSIDRVLKICRTKSNILFVSHSFFLKLLTIYLDCPDIFLCPRLLKNYFDPRVRTFNFNQIIILKSRNHRIYYKISPFFPSLSREGPGVGFGVKIHHDYEPKKQF